MLGPMGSRTFVGFLDGADAEGLEAMAFMGDMACIF